MHISNASSYVGVAALRGGQSVERANGADLVLEEQDNGADPIADVMANYDLQNITPAEIDQLVDELKSAGHPVDENLLTLSARGAEFRSHLSDIVGGAYDPHQRVNLIDQTQDQLVMARRFGDPTEALERFLDYLQSHNAGEQPDTQLQQQRSVHEAMMRQKFTLR